MANTKFRKPILLQEEFAAGEVSNPNQNATPAIKTDSTTVGIDQTATANTGDEVRAEIIQDVDTILTNLEQLSKQITESVLNESLDELLKGIMSKVAAAQGEGYLKKYLPLLQAANQNLIDARIFKVQQPLEDALLKITTAKEKAKGEAKKPLIAKAEQIRQKKAKVEMQKEALKAKADEKVEKLKVKMAKAEGQMAGALKERYTAMKAKVVSDVNIEGLKAKAKVALAKDNKDAADKIATEMQDLKDRQDEISQAIKDGESQSKEDLAELNGIKPFMAEVAAFSDANGKADAVRQEISDASGMYESLKEGLDYLTLVLNEDIMALYNGAKKDGNVADISKAKTLAAKLKSVEAEVYKAKKALYDKVASTTVTNKSIIDLAGGDPEKAGGKEGEWKMGELKAKWGGAEGFVAPEEYAPIKNAQEIEDGADKAIEDAELKNQEGGNDDEGGNDEGGNDDTPREMTDKEKESLAKAEAGLAKAQEKGDEKLIDRYKKLIAGIKDTSKVGEGFDIDAEISRIEETEELEEGNEFGAARAEAIAKGEKTFKVGDEEYPVEDVSKDDKENAEEFVEEAKEELPKKVKLYEGMSVADRFKALM